MHTERNNETLNELKTDIPNERTDDIKETTTNYIQKEGATGHIAKDKLNNLKQNERTN